MWSTKEFESREQLDKFIQHFGDKYQIEEIFINNGFAVEYRPLKKM